MDDGSHSPAVLLLVSVRGRKPIMAKKLLGLRYSFSGNEKEERKLAIGCPTSGFLILSLGFGAG